MRTDEEERTSEESSSEFGFEDIRKIIQFIMPSQRISSSMKCEFMKTLEAT